MILQSLPDELFVKIFCYLHKFDLLYAFTNLNRRFQQIIEPYSYDIDLTYIPYRHFQLLVKYILPFYAHNVRSLKLADVKHLHLFRPYVGQLINVECLTIGKQGAREFNNAEELEKFLKEALPSLPSLSQLSILTVETKILQTITSNGRNLKSLTFIGGHELDHFSKLSEMPNIRRLSISLRYVEMLATLFKITPNLEELNLSMLKMHTLKLSNSLGGVRPSNATQKLEAVFASFVLPPKRLEKMHFETGGYGLYSYQPNFKIIKLFLNIFKNQLRSLTLIVINAQEDFYDFQSLVSDFTHLQIFEYYINLVHSPDSSSLLSNVEQQPDLTYSIYSKPRPQQFDILSYRQFPVEYYFTFELLPQYLCHCEKLSINECDSQLAPSLALMELNDNLKFKKLKKIKFHVKLDDMPDDILQYLLRITTRSSNLDFLSISTDNLKNFINHLFTIISIDQLKHITYFELDPCWENDTDFPATFFADLSKIMPNLKVFKILVGQQQLLDKPLPNFVQNIRCYFSKLFNLIIDIYLENNDDGTIFGGYRNDLDEIRKQTENSIYYVVQRLSHSITHCYLNIWL